MKRIFVQKTLFLYTSILSALLIALGVLCGMHADKSLFGLAAVGAILFLVSLSMLVNRIYYDRERIKVKFISINADILYSEIKEIYVEKLSPFGVKMVISCDEEISFTNEKGELVFPPRMIDYQKEFSKRRLRDGIFFEGISRKDARRLIENYSGKIYIRDNALNNNQKNQNT